MAGPVSGVSGQQNFPAATTFQKTENNAQPEEAKVKGVEEVEGEEKDSVRAVQEETSSISESSSKPAKGESQERGSLVDVTV